MESFDPNYLSVILAFIALISTAFGNFIACKMNRTTALRQSSNEILLTAKREAYATFSRSFSVFFARFNPEDNVSIPISHFYALMGDAHAALVLCDPPTASLVEKYIVTMHTFYFAGDADTNKQVYQSYCACVDAMRSELFDLQKDSSRKHFSMFR